MFIWHEQFVIITGILRQSGACVSSTLTLPLTTKIYCSDDISYIITKIPTRQPLHPFPEHVCRQQPACTRSSLYICIYFLSPDAQHPPSRLLAHYGPRNEVSDLCEMYGEGEPNSEGSSEGCFSGGGAESAPLSRRVRGALAPRSSLDIEGVPISGGGPSQNGTCLGGAIGSKLRAGRTTYCLL